MAPRTSQHLERIVLELVKLPNESEWVEFKENNAKPNEVGEYVSALSNSAALLGKDKGYLIWGIEDCSHTLVGTTFSALSTKVGNEELVNWLMRLLTPQVFIQFHEIQLQGQPVVLLEIDRALRQPTQFKGVEYIRVGSYKKKLKDQSEVERRLWRVFDQITFEDQIAAEEIDGQHVLTLLNYPQYFELIGAPLPDGVQRILESLEQDRLIRRAASGAWNITGLGAVLFAKDLRSFSSLRRKAVRVILYKGKNRIETVREQEGVRGYAAGFEGLIDFINGLIPANEVVGAALRKAVPMYPEVAIRELVANALIHQDFLVAGAGPMIEIFVDRLEITNPGVPLIETERFLDNPPRSRNEDLASLMRRVGVCEERGSGIDKVVWQTEYYQLPAPAFEVSGQSTRALLFAHRSYAEMEKPDRLRACYLHACLKHVSGDFMTNSSLRERFGIRVKNAAMVSRLINEARAAGLIRPYDEDAAKKRMKYLPYWA